MSIVISCYTCVQGRRTRTRRTTCATAARCTRTRAASRAAASCGTTRWTCSAPCCRRCRRSRSPASTASPSCSPTCWPSARGPRSEVPMTEYVDVTMSYDSMINLYEKQPQNVIGDVAAYSPFQVRLFQFSKRDIS